ncbi:MAG: hypothetical protein ACE5IE_04840 [Dehalococcoidia bacterium]
MTEENRFQVFLIGLLAGGIIGSVLTIFVAQRLRKQLKERGIDLDRAGELATLAKERGDQFLVRAREIIRQAIEEGRKAASKARSELGERFEKESGE